MDSDLARFVHDENIKHLKRKLEAATNQAERRKLVKLLAEVEANADKEQSQPKQTV